MRISSKVCFLQMDTGDHQVLQATDLRCILCGKFCLESRDTEAAGRLCPRALPQGSVCTNSLGKLIHRHRDRAETHCGQAENPPNYSQEEAGVNAPAPETGSGLVLLRKITDIRSFFFLKHTENETFFHFYPMRSINYLRVK